MENNQKRRLSLMFLILGGLIFLSGVVSIIIISDEPPQHRTDLPCYDKEGNVIIGVSCAGYSYPPLPNIPVLCFILSIICFVIARYSYPKE